MLKISKKILILIFLLVILFACQKTEILQEIVFDNSQLDKISIHAEKIEVVSSYKPALNNNYIDSAMHIPPNLRIISWVNDNIKNFGTENKLVVDITKASITQKDFIENDSSDNSIYKQEEYHYEINLKVDFFLYNDDNQVLSTVHAKSYRSTTSGKLISLNERNKILDLLTLDSLQDLTNQSIKLLRLHMSEYIL